MDAIACEAVPHGMLAHMPLTLATEPGEAVAVARALLPRLLLEERALARTLPPLRRQSWVAGRVVLTAALEAIGAPRTPLLCEPRGAARLPAGFSGSISHTRGLVAALAAPAHAGSIGIDVEALSPARMRIGERVLCPAERAAVAALEPAARWRATLLRFSLKEAFYKAIDRLLGRFLGFEACEVEPLPCGGARLRPRLRPGEGPFEVEGWWTERERFVITTCRVRAVSVP